MKRYRILFAAVLMQTCLGATYSWSVYVQLLRGLAGLSQGAVQTPFTVFYFVFPATAAFAGSLLERVGPRRCAVLGGILFGGGWLLAGLGGRGFGFTVAGIGVLAGLGAGLAYLVPISTCVRWFPRHKGLVTGIAVAGFGGGAALVSQLAGFLMAGRGANPFQVFALLGATFLVVIAAAGTAMAYPPRAEGAPGRPAAASSAPFAPGEFAVLYAAMLVGLAAGFAVNANLREIGHGATVQAGVTAVSLFALANALGRVSWGWIFDRTATPLALRVNLGAQALTLAAAPWLARSQSGFWALAVATGFNYGGVLVLYAAATARRWGAEGVGRLYGRLFSANIPAALAPLLAGIWYDRFGSFRGPLWIGAALLVVIALPLGRLGGPASGASLPGSTELRRGGAP